MARRLKRDKRWGLLKLGFFVCVFVSIFTLIWLSTAVVDLEKNLSQMKGQKRALVNQGKLISAEMAKIYSVAMVDKVAVEQLGMSHPNRGKIFFVKRATGAAPYKASAKSFLALPNTSSGSMD
ncbi:MAG: hypothetical protein AAB221_04670 [Bacteroidota bacterium]